MLPPSPPTGGLLRRWATILVALAATAGLSSCCWSASRYRATKIPQSQPAPREAPLRVVVDAKTVKQLLHEMTARAPVFKGPLSFPAVTRKIGLGCRAPAFGHCDPCRSYSLLSSCSPLVQRDQPCRGQAPVTEGGRLRWANEKCPGDKADCAILAAGLGVSLSTKQAAYQVRLTNARLELGDGQVRAQAELSSLKVRATTILRLLDRCGKPTSIPLVKLPEQCPGVEVGIKGTEPIRVAATLVVEPRGQELWGRLKGPVNLTLPTKGVFVKQRCYTGKFLGYDIRKIVQQETVTALERELPKRRSQAQEALTDWLTAKLSRPLVDALPKEFKVAIAGGELTFQPRLSQVRVTPAAITVEAAAQVLVPYALINAELAKVGRVRASSEKEDPLWLSDLKAEPGPGGTLLLRAKYRYEWKRAGVVSGGGRGTMAFAGRGELHNGSLRLGEVHLLEVDPSDSGCFDDRMRRRVEKAIKGPEIRKLQITLQSQIDEAVEQLRARRWSREGLTLAINPGALTAQPVFQKEGVRLQLSGSLHPRLVPKVGRPVASRGKASTGGHD